MQGLTIRWRRDCLRGTRLKRGPRAFSGSRRSVSPWLAGGLLRRNRSGERREAETVRDVVLARGTLQPPLLRQLCAHLKAGRRPCGRALRNSPLTGLADHAGQAAQQQPPQDHNDTCRPAPHRPEPASWKATSRIATIGRSETATHVKGLLCLTGTEGAPSVANTCGTGTDAEETCRGRLVPQFTQNCAAAVATSMPHVGQNMDYASESREVISIKRQSTLKRTGLGFHRRTDMRTPLRLLSALALGSAIACGAPETPTGPTDLGSTAKTVALRGTVRDFATSAPRSGLQLQFTNGDTSATTTATTDTSGVYAATVSTAGAYTAQTSNAVIGFLLVSGPTYAGDMWVDSGTCRSRYGALTDSRTLRPIAGATVSILERSTTSGSDGSYRLDLGCGPTANVSTTSMAITHNAYQRRDVGLGRGVQDVVRLDLALDPNP